MLPALALVNLHCCLRMGLESQQSSLSINPNCSFHELCGNTPGPQVLEHPTFQLSASDSGSLGPGRVPPQKTKLGCPASCRLSSPVFSRARGASAHLCGLEYCESLKMFMGGVWGAPTTIARPGSSASCLLDKRELTVDSLPSPPPVDRAQAFPLVFPPPGEAGGPVVPCGSFS